MNTTKGFTFIELLVSMAVVSLVGLAVYSVFANGIGAWRRGTIDKTYLRSIRINSEKIVRDLRNTFGFSNIAFEGTEDFVRFPALILVTSDSDQEEEIENHYEVGRITYFYDEGEKSLCKEKKTYPEIFEEGDLDDDVSVDDLAGEALVTGLNSLKFSYCYLDNTTQTYDWKDDWKKEEQDSIPQAVKIEMSFEEDFIEEGEFNRTILIPIGTGEQKIVLGTETILDIQ